MIACAALGALAVVAVRETWRAAEAAWYRPDDVADLIALVDARARLDVGLLEARAGIRLHFDAIHRAMRVLGEAPRIALVVRGRGAAFTEAADALDRLAAESRDQKPGLEQVMTEMALLRLSTRYFPVAAEAATGDGSGADADPAAARAREVRQRAVRALRTDVEHYIESPASDVAGRLEAEITDLGAARADLDEQGRADLDALLGHARVIRDKRERVDVAVRQVVRSEGAADAREALTAYERASRYMATRATALRIAAAELVAACFALLVAAAWRARAR
jgi:DAHL domain